MTDIREMSQQQIDDLNQNKPVIKRRRKARAATTISAIEDATLEEIQAALNGHRSELARALDELNIKGGLRVTGSLVSVRQKVTAFMKQSKKRFTTSKGLTPDTVIVVRIEPEPNDANS